MNNGTPIITTKKAIIKRTAVAGVVRGGITSSMFTYPYSLISALSAKTMGRRCDPSHAPDEFAVTRRRKGFAKGTRSLMPVRDVDHRRKHSLNARSATLWELYIA